MRILPRAVLLLFIAGFFMSCPAEAVDEAEWKETIGQALAAINGGRIEEGLGLVRERIRREPKEPAWRAALAEQLMQLGAGVGARDTEDPKKRFAEAEKEFLAAGKLFSGSKNPNAAAQCYVLVGQIHEAHHRDIEKAFSYYKQALDLNPQHPDAKAGASRYGQYRLGQAMQKGGTAKPAASASKLEQLKEAVMPRPAAQGPVEQIRLKNGQIMHGRIVERDANGIWVEIDRGARTYLKNSEMAGAAAPPKPAAFKPDLRACTIDDVLGRWEKSRTLTASPLQNNAEIFRFHKEGLVQHSQITGQVDPAVIEATFAAIKPSIRYEIGPDGRMLWHYPEHPSLVGTFDCRVASPEELHLRRHQADGVTLFDEISLRKTG